MQPAGVGRVGKGEWVADFDSARFVGLSFTPEGTPNYIWTQCGSFREACGVGWLDWAHWVE